MSAQPNQTAQPPHKFLLELGPLLVFFGVNAWKGIIWGTGALMAAMTIAIAISWRRDRKVPPMMWITGITVLFFGGLTIWLDDELFIKLKVTLVNIAFGAILFYGLLTGRVFLKSLLGQAFQLTDPGWRALTRRYAFFFFLLAGLNELVWRNLSTDHWVTFKVFGLMGLTLLFTVSQFPLIQRHQENAEDA